MGGVVVGDEPALDSAEVGEDAGVADGAVAPADFLGVFFVGVLGFVDEDVGAADEIEEREVGAQDAIMERTDWSFSRLPSYFSPVASTVWKCGASFSLALTETSISRKPAAVSHACKSVSLKPSQRSA